MKNYTIYRKNNFRKVLVPSVLLVFVTTFGFLTYPRTADAFFFGGKIKALLPPAPFGPCPAPAIVILNPPFGGVFMLPPVTLYGINKLLPGRYVLGLAVGNACGQIIMVAASS